MLTNHSSSRKAAESAQHYVTVQSIYTKSCVAIILRIQTVNTRTVPHCAYLHVGVLSGIDVPNLRPSAWLLMLHLLLLRYVLNMFLQDGCPLGVHAYRRLHARESLILEIEAARSSETSASSEFLRGAIPTVGVSLCPQLHIKSSSIDTLNKTLQAELRPAAFTYARFLYNCCDAFIKAL